MSSNKTNFLILGITAIILSRLTFFVVNDPEGPNLLIVTVLAAIIFALSFALCRKKLWVTILIQILLAVLVALGFFFTK